MLRAASSIAVALLNDLAVGAGLEDSAPAHHMDRVDPYGGRQLIGDCTPVKVGSMTGRGFLVGFSHRGDLGGDSSYLLGYQKG